MRPARRLPAEGLRAVKIAGEALAGVLPKADGKTRPTDGRSAAKGQKLAARHAPPPHGTPSPLHRARGWHEGAGTTRRGDRPSWGAGRTCRAKGAGLLPRLFHRRSGFGFGFGTLASRSSSTCCFSLGFGVRGSDAPCGGVVGRPPAGSIPRQHPLADLSKERG